MVDYCGVFEVILAVDLGENGSDVASGDLNVGACVLKAEVVVMSVAGVRSLVVICYGAYSCGVRGERDSID